MARNYFSKRVDEMMDDPMGAGYLNTSPFATKHHSHDKFHSFFFIIFDHLFVVYEFSKDKEKR